MPANWNVLRPLEKWGQTAELPSDNGKVELQFGLPQLSAQWAAVKLPGWSEHKTLKVTVEGDSDIRVLYAKSRPDYSGSGPSALGEGPLLEIANPGGTFQQGEDLLILLINKKAVSPFESVTSVHVTVESKGSDDIIDVTQNGAIVWFNTNAGCTSSGDAGSIGCTGYFYFHNDLGSKSKPVPIVWDQEDGVPRFTVDGSLVETIGTREYTYTLYMTAKYDAATRQLYDGYFRYKQISHSLNGGISSEAEAELRLVQLPYEGPEPPEPPSSMFWTMRSSDYGAGALQAVIESAKYTYTPGRQGPVLGDHAGLLGEFVHPAGLSLGVAERGAGRPDTGRHAGGSALRAGGFLLVRVRSFAFISGDPANRAIWRGLPEVTIYHGAGVMAQSRTREGARFLALSSSVGGDSDNHQPQRRSDSLLSAGREDGVGPHALPLCQRADSF